MKTTTLLLSTAAALFLAACNSEAPAGSPAGHTLATETETTLAPPTVEARSDTSALQGAVSAPGAAAQSQRYRLVTTNLQPKFRK